MRVITDAIPTSAMTRTAKSPSFMMDRFPKASSRWSAWWPSRSCRDATKRGRSLCCGAAAPSRAPISCSNGSQDKRRLSIRHRSPPAVTSATSSYKSDREMSLSTSPTTSPLPSCSTHSDQIALSIKMLPILKASNRAGPLLVGRDHIRVRVATGAHSLRPSANKRPRRSLKECGTAPLSTHPREACRDSSRRRNAPAELVRQSSKGEHHVHDCRPCEILGGLRYLCSGDLHGIDRFVCGGDERGLHRPAVPAKGGGPQERPAAWHDRLQLLGRPRHGEAAPARHRWNPNHLRF